MKEISKYIIQFITHSFSNGYKPPSLSDTSKQFIAQLYNNIQNAESQWRTVDTPYTYDFTKDPLPKGNMYSYMRPEIKELIETSMKIGKKYTFSINSQTIQLHIVFPFSQKDPAYQISSQKQTRYFHDIAHRVYLWLYLANDIKKNKCSHELHIYIYLTNLFKIMPSNDLDTIDQIHANTAYTTSCSSKNEIYIFREEEWFKVLIHETFHSSGMDFSHSDKLTQLANTQIRTIFPIPVDNLALYETYCELFANNINILFYLYNKQTPETRVIKEYEKYLYYEQLFACFQCVKVLRHSHLIFENLYQMDPVSIRKRNLYKEKVNAFSYYILKSIYIWNMESVYQWVLQSNHKSLKFIQTPANINRFIHIIAENYQTNSFNSKIKEVENWYLSNPTDINKIEHVTLRMSVTE